MEKRLRKNIKKEFRKIVRNISGESSDDHHENNASPQQVINVVGTRTVEVQPVIPQCNTQGNTEDSNNNQQHEKQANDESIAYDPMEDLSKNFHSILEKECFSDVTIKCGTDVIKAHKIILCARSPVFEAMFTNDMKESKDGEVDIVDIEPQVLRDLLVFVYSGQLNLNDLTVTKACDLLYAADKYRIRTLKQLCVNYLRSNLSVENAFQILECSNLLDGQLRSHTLKYISEQFPAIEKTDEWKTVQLNSPTLALEVYLTVVNTLREKK